MNYEPLCSANEILPQPEVLPLRPAAPAADRERHHPLRRLQRTAGNRAVQHLVRAKLKVSQSDDPNKREADRVAAQLGGGSAVPYGGLADSSRLGLRLWRSPATGPDSGQHVVSNGFLADLDAGQPLDAGTLAYFENRLGVDFGDVRVHADAGARHADEKINARAFTVGNRIVFGDGEYAPETSAGRSLLAHELAHVVQQRREPGPRIQRQPETKPVNWVPGMWAKLLKPYDYGGVKLKAGELVEVTSEAALIGYVSYVKAWPPGPRKPESKLLSIDTKIIEPVEPPKGVVPEDQVQFQVNALSAATFASATGVDPASLPEGTMISLDQALSGWSSPAAPWLHGAAPGAGYGWGRAPWPAFSVPANATGVQWTQSAFGHSSQFANVPGEPVIGGYRSWGAIHGYQGAHSQITGRPWARPVPGRYFNDWWFRLMSAESQTLVYRPGAPQHAELVAGLIRQGRYTEHYSFPPTTGGTKCTNCITVPQSQTYGALGGRPVVVTDTGIYDITEFGRPSPEEPFSVEQAGRGKTMREWLARPTVETPTGQIETLEVAHVPRGIACIRAGGIVLLIFGAHHSKERLEEAAGTPHFHRVVGQETGSWIGGIIGGAVGAAAASAVACSPTGPGAFVCAAAGFVGGLIVGAAGSVLGAMGGDYFAEKLGGVGEAFETAGQLYGPMLERSIWGNKPIPEIDYYPPRQYWEIPFEYEQDKERYYRSLRR